MTSRLISLAIVMVMSVSSLWSQMETIIRSESPKLVVGIVVEQMRQDYVERYWDAFGDKGFKRLANNGTYCKNANLNYSLTQTSPGFATIVTGCEPGGHGIVSDYWFNYLSARKEGCIDDGNAWQLDDKSRHGGFSPQNMLTTTFSDEAKLFHRGAGKVVSISLTPEGAVLSGGHAANAAYWMNLTTGKWTSSSFYMDKLPQWVNDINDRHAIDDYLDKTWTPMADSSVYNNVLPDSNAYEFGIDGIYKTFPYVYRNMTKTVPDYDLFTMIPEGNTLVTDMSVAALYEEKLGQSEATDFLFINYAVSEKVGRLFGPQSIEVEDLFLRLDQELGHLVEAIEDVVGKNNVLIYLTSNHGVADAPQYLIDNKMPAGIFKHYYILALLKSYLKSVYGEGDWILDYNNSQIFLNKTLIEDSRIALAEFQERVISFIINSSGISNAIGSHQFQNIVFRDGMPQKMQNSYSQKRSGDIMISLRAGWLEDIPFCTDHGSGYRYDTNVPLIWYGWKVKKQKLLRHINITAIAPTIATMLGTPPPPSATGEIIPDIFNIR